MLLSAAAAQVATGYYRVKNLGSSRFVSIANNKLDDTNQESLKGANGGTIYAMKTISESAAMTDPSTIIYIENQGTSYVFSNQGMNTSDLLPTEVKLRVISRDGYYQLAGSYSGAMQYLSDSYSMADNCGFTMIVGSSAAAETHWDFLPLSETNYLAVRPELAVNGKYYTTLFTAFPYQVGTGMKAYFIKNTTGGVAGKTEQYAEMVEITDGKVAANTPVILECASQEPGDNKLTPLALNSGVTAPMVNFLYGQYFSFVKMSMSGGENSNALGQQLKNVVEYNANTMRVLGVKDGKLCFVKAADSQLYVTRNGKYLPANKAYIKFWDNQARYLNETIGVVDTKDYQTLGISSVENGENIRHTGIYSLSGVRVREDAQTDGLAKGIYIIDGKKTVIR